MTQQLWQTGQESIPALEKPSFWAAWSLGKLWLAALVIGVLYLPFLPTGFDFADDSDYAYPSDHPSFSSFLVTVKDRTLNDFRDRGPFRPVAWAWWTGQGELFGGNPLPWRVVRLLWT